MFPLRLRWNRKRRVAAAVLAFLLAYPLSFWPACWVAVRLDPTRHRSELRFFGALYQPVILVLSSLHDSARHWIFASIEIGTPEDVFFFRGPGVGWFLPDRGDYLTF